VPHDPDLRLSTPNKSISTTHGGTFLCQVWQSWLHRFFRHCADKQINATKNPTLATAVGVGKSETQNWSRTHAALWLFLLLVEAPITASCPAAVQRTSWLLADDVCSAVKSASMTLSSLFTTLRSINFTLSTATTNIITISGQISLINSCIAILSLLEVANWFVLTWPHLGPNKSVPKRHLDLFTRFCTAHSCVNIAHLTPTCRAVIEDLIIPFAAYCYSRWNDPFAVPFFYLLV